MKLEARQKLAQVIKKARGSQSQRAYGRLIGVSGTAVRLWEEMRSIPDADNMEQIAKTAGFTIDELRTYLNGEPPTAPAEIDRLIKQIRYMSEKEFAAVVRAVGDRLNAIAS
jgi:transcriptional regulator with XRE-family HTH domain